MSITKVIGANKEHKVFLYTLSTCGWCKKTKSYLSDNDVEYDYIDLDKITREEQKKAVEELKKKKIPVAFPIIIIDDDIIISGFKQYAIAEAIGL